MPHVKYVATGVVSLPKNGIYLSPRDEDPPLFVNNKTTEPIQVIVKLNSLIVDYQTLIRGNPAIQTAYETYINALKQAVNNHRSRVHQALKDPKNNLLARINLAGRQKEFEIKLAQANFDAAIEQFPNIKKVQDEMKKYENINNSMQARRFTQQLNDEDKSNSESNTF